MTYKDVPEGYIDGCAMCTRYCGECETEIIIKALKKQYKYRWHDLRKNPEDLPADDTMVTICYKMFGSGKKYDSAMRSFCVHDGYQWTNTLCYFSNVIAWREIEPFEECDT